MRVLFIGGTGIISSGCAKRLAERADVSLSFMVRGRTDRPVPKGVEVIQGDVREPASVRAALGARTFDAVVNWVAFTIPHIEADIEFFRGRTGQYVFISSASAYQTPPEHLPVTEKTPLVNPFWQYSRDKIACEELLVRAHRDERAFRVARDELERERKLGARAVGDRGLVRLHPGRAAAGEHEPEDADHGSGPATNPALPPVFSTSRSDSMTMPWERALHMS